MKAANKIFEYQSKLYLNTVRCSMLICLFVALSFNSYGQNFSAPAITRDGNFLLFTAGNNEDRALYISHADGSNIKLLIDVPGYETGTHWSPDGKSIVFCVEKNIYTVKINGKGLKNLTNGSLSGVQTTKWIDKDKIIFSYGEFPLINVYTMSVKGKILDQLTEKGFNYYPDLSGEALVYCRGSRDLNERGIYYRSSSITNTVRLSPTGEAPVFSPNGSHIAFQDSFDRISQIYIIDKKGTNKRQITKEFSSELPAWSPDGEFIYYQQKRNGEYEIWRINIESGNSKLIMNSDTFKKNY